jgi:hypothetical protein
MAHGTGRDIIEAFPVVDIANFKSVALFVDAVNFTALRLSNCRSNSVTWIDLNSRNLDRCQGR